MYPILANVIYKRVKQKKKCYSLEIIKKFTTKKKTGRKHRKVIKIGSKKV